MASIVKCPTCGAKNPEEQEFCLFCQSRLKPLTGPLKGMDETIKPGDIPTKKDTGDLEPILPQWLRDVRGSSQTDSEDEKLTDAPPPQETPQEDLFAGLNAQSQEQDEEDIPDWLLNLTGETPQSKQTESKPASEIRWVELGGKNDFAQEEESQSLPQSSDETPSWLADLKPSASPSDEKNEMEDWFQSAAKNQPSSIDDNSFSAPAPEDTQNWLRAMSADGDMQEDDKSSTPIDFGAPASSADTPDWLRSLDSQEGAQKDDAFSDELNNIFNSPSASDAPNWLDSMSAQDESQSADSAYIPESGFGESGDDVSSSAGNVPDWLKDLESNAPVESSSADQDWMKELQVEEQKQPEQDNPPAWLKADAPAEQTETPSWLSNASDSDTQQPMLDSNSAQAGDDSFGDVPSWLKAAAPQSTIFGDSSDEQAAPSSASYSAETPDWLKAFKSEDTPGAQPTPALIFDSAPDGNTDALFTEMPDWLSSNADEQVSLPSSSIPSPITNADALAPGDLPSWVQAMRPVDSGSSQSSSGARSSDQTYESQGALAGLQGVLPAAAGFTPTSKPRAHSIKLQADEDQQSQADLLERILIAETEPIPLTSPSIHAASRALRWVLAFALFVSLTAVLYLRTQIFPMPLGVPSEIVDSLRVVQSIPQGAPVVVAFDYEPARIGEMEAAAVPVFDQMLLLEHPRLIFISTNETGPALAEHFISGPLGGFGYQKGNQYLNLGYLPGGQSAIRAFANDPATTASYAFAQNDSLFNLAPVPAWALPPLAGVTSFSQFAALIIVTDNADSARMWIEQTTVARGAMPVVVISSAQASPMIQPYYASRQINGLVSGLYGGAVFEQNNAGRPGTARIYWDAYNIGMLLAVIFILGGGLWNLVLGLRDRSAAREAK